MLTLRSQSSWITNGGISFRTLPCTYVVSTQWFLLHFLRSSKTISIWEFVRQINMHSRCWFLFIHFCPKSANVLKLEGEDRFLAVKLRSSSICHSNARYALLITYITISSWMTKSIRISWFLFFAETVKGRNAFCLATTTFENGNSAYFFPY